MFLALLFQPEFAPQQLARIVGDLPQPLFQRLAAFAVEGRFDAGELFFAGFAVIILPRLYGRRFALFA